METKYVRDNESYKPLRELKRAETNYSVKNLQSYNTKADSSQKKIK
jgi:hypothetical protein